MERLEDRGEGDLGSRTNYWENSNSLFAYICCPRATGIGAEILEFAAPGIVEVFSGRKSFKLAAMSMGKQTLRKQMGSGSKQRRIIPTKSTKQTNRFRRYIFTDISR